MSDVASVTQIWWDSDSGIDFMAASDRIFFFGFRNNFLTNFDLMLAMGCHFNGVVL